MTFNSVQYIATALFVGVPTLAMVLHGPWRAPMVKRLLVLYLKGWDEIPCPKPLLGALFVAGAWYPYIVSWVER